MLVCPKYDDFWVQMSLTNFRVELLYNQTFPDDKLN